MDNTFWNNFLSNFFANLLSDVIVGTFLATGVAWWVGKKMSEFERSQHRKDEKRAEIEKAIRYLEFLKDEIRYLIEQLPGLIRLFEETGWGREIRLPTAYWDVLQPSGELPRLLKPQVLATLTLFYDHLSYAKSGKDRVLDAWLVPQPKSVPGMDEKLRAFVSVTLAGLKNACESGKDLPGLLDSEIQDLKAKLANLK